MEKLLLVWIALIAIEVFFNWREFEVKKKSIVHWIWLIHRVVAGLIVLYFMVQSGYQWYWAGLYILSTHLLLFAEGLNKSRGKDFGYLGDPDPNSEEKSKFDALLQKIKGVELPWLGFRIILAICGIGIILWCGTCEFRDMMQGVWY